jgi:hypothetical protein
MEPTITQFAALIESAIARNTRAKLVSFLDRFNYVEFGRARALTTPDRALVLRCVDEFLLNHSAIDLGVTEFRNLRAQLSKLAHDECGFTDRDAVNVRNTCFDALACITALEARLARTLDRAEVRLQAQPTPLSVANDE